MLLLCALIAGSSSAWAGTNISTVSTKFTKTGDVTSNFTQTGDFTSAAWNLAVTWDSEASWQNLDGTKGAQIGSGSKPATGIVLTGSNISGTITSVVVNTSGAKSINATVAVSVGGTGFTCSGNATASLTSSAADYTFTGSGTGNVVITWANNSSKAIYIKSVTITYSGGTSKVATPTISGNEAFLTSTTVSISCGTEGATIKYSTDGTNWNNYSAPFTLTATTTVKAKATKSGLTDSDEATKTFTKATPTTVTAALAAIDDLADNETIEGQCVAGIISQVVSYSSNAITYWISDDGTTTSQLEVYNGKGLNGANFTAKTDLNVGDQVKVFGTLKKYVSGSNTTPEFDAGSQLLSYEATGAPAPAINASNVTIDSETTSGEITYTIDNPTTASLTAAVKSGDWISNVQVDGGNNKVTFSVTQNTGEQRIGYITLSYEGATNKDVKITQKASYGTATLPFAFDGGKSDVATTAGFSPNSLGSDYSSSPKLKFDGEGDYLILKINGAAEVLNFDIKGNGTSSEPWEGTFKVQTSADGVTYTDLKTYTKSILTSDVLNESLDNVPSSARYIKWIYITKTKGNVALGRIGVNCDAITIPEAGYLTYCNAKKALGFAGVTAYKVSNVGATSVTLTEITEAPANTPVILNGAAGTYALDIIASAAEVTGNKLEVSDGSITTTDGTTVYALASKGEPAVVGFYKVKAGVKVPAGKCYLSVALTSAPDFLGFGGDDTTGIDMVKGEGFKVNGEFYNLNGQRVAQPMKGLYIVNGKKVIIK